RGFGRRGKRPGGGENRLWVNAGAANGRAGGGAGRVSAALTRAIVALTRARVARAAAGKVQCRPVRAVRRRQGGVGRPRKTPRRRGQVGALRCRRGVRRGQESMGRRLLTPCEPVLRRRNKVTRASRPCRI